MERFIEPLVRAGISESTIEDILCKIDEAQEVISEEIKDYDKVRGMLGGNEPKKQLPAVKEQPQQKPKSDGINTDLMQAADADVQLKKERKQATADALAQAKANRPYRKIWGDKIYKK